MHENLGRGGVTHDRTDQAEYQPAHVVVEQPESAYVTSSGGGEVAVGRAAGSVVPPSGIPRRRHPHFRTGYPVAHEQPSGHRR